MKDLKGNTIEGAPSPLKLIASHAGFAELTNRELMIHSLQQLENNLISDNNMGKPHWLARHFPTKLKPITVATLCITQDNGDSIEGHIDLGHSGLETQGYFGFSVRVINTNNNDENTPKTGIEHLSGLKRQVTFFVPEYVYPITLGITTNIGRMEVSGFIKEMAQSKTGLDATLMLLVEPPKTSEGSPTIH